MIAIICIICYFAISLGINYYKTYKKNNDVAYLGIKKCERCNNLAHLYIKENASQTFTFMYCSVCHEIKPLSDYDKMYLIENNIPFPQKCQELL